MPSLVLLRRNWRALLATIATLGALALLWAVRARPLQPAPFVRVDALSAFFCFALLGGIALAAFAWPGSHPLGWRTFAGAALLLIGWSTTLPPIVVMVYLLFALLGVNRRPTTNDQRPTTGDETPTNGKRRPTTDDRSDGGGLAGRVRQVWGVIQRGLAAVPDLVAAGALVVG